MDDVKAAAERVRQIESGEDVFVVYPPQGDLRLNADCERLARAYLELVPLVDRLQSLNAELADRVLKQSELLSKRAERTSAVLGITEAG